MQYRTIDIAKNCNVTVNTVRNWCREYGAFLSPGASGGTGHRNFTGRDLDVFKYIAQLRAENMQRYAILQRLSETTFAEIDAPREDTAIAQPDALDTPGQALAPVVAHDYVLALERRVEAVEQSRDEDRQAQRAGWWWWAVGLLCGLGLAVVFELAAIMVSRGH